MKFTMSSVWEEAIPLRQTGTSSTGFILNTWSKMSSRPPLARLCVFGCGGHLKTWDSLPSLVSGLQGYNVQSFSPLRKLPRRAALETAPTPQLQTDLSQLPVPASASLRPQETDRSIAGPTLKSRRFSKARERPACTHGPGTRSQEIRWGGGFGKWGIQVVTEVPETLSEGSCPSGHPAPFAFLLINQCPYFTSEEQLPPKFSPWNSSSCWIQRSPFHGWH